MYQIFEQILELLASGKEYFDLILFALGFCTGFGVRNFFKMTVCLSIGQFRIQRKYFDVQNVTNIVSANFYNGGQIPDSVRKEIIMLTSPKVTKLK